MNAPSGPSAPVEHGRQAVQAATREPDGADGAAADDSVPSRPAPSEPGAAGTHEEHGAQEARSAAGTPSTSGTRGASRTRRHVVGEKPAGEPRGTGSVAPGRAAPTGEHVGVGMSGASGRSSRSDASEPPHAPVETDGAQGPAGAHHVPGPFSARQEHGTQDARSASGEPGGVVGETPEPVPARSAPGTAGTHEEDGTQDAPSTSGAAPRAHGDGQEGAVPHAAATRVDADAEPLARTSAGQAYADAEREAVYRTIRERRDVRVGFRPDPIAHDLLTRILEAAHQAPSVGHAKPWDFLVVDDRALRTRVHDLARAEREGHARSLPGTRAHAFSGLKVEAILEAPLNIAVTVDPTRGPRPAAGRDARPMNAPYSAALAVENLWLAARAEGLGVGWVSFLDERDVARALDLPPHLDVVAYLCVGHVDEFPTEPELGLGGWAKGRPLSWAVHHDRYGRRGLPGREPTSLLEETIAAIGALSARAVEEARDRQSRMAKPPGSLGVLEEVSVRLAGLSGECPPPIPEPAAVAVFAGDHGVHAQGVTPWPQEVTAQMVQTFLSGGAVVNAFAAQVGADVTVVDVGVVADLPPSQGLLPRKVARGTADPTQGPAMTRPQVLQALETGIEVARDLVSAGHRCLITGDMGIANTTPSAALVCAYTGASPEDATGVGTGVDEQTHKRKVDVVRRALEANPVDASDPVGTLAALGGLEHAALAGFVLGGAAMRVPVLLDGVIAGSAALAAAAISPESVSACFAGHRSSEPGHAAALDHLGLRPLVDLEMRLGEGSGALLALPMLQASARALRSVATLEDSGITAAP
nr:nicotinate-nucleotide--dimethylbenzimidazole phosphoribosyltransferase [Nocardiopsis coralli]